MGLRPLHRSPIENYRADDTDLSSPCLSCPSTPGSVSWCRSNTARHVDDIEEKFDILRLFNSPHPRHIDLALVIWLGARKVVGVVCWTNGNMTRDECEGGGNIWTILCVL
ncbi:hypothetical protein BaRGS_00032092 [Batillaria attramentaria]|uniref:Uncharacterized protein n=1 Tax=Batillaria attramentaria TaxID=370345 RepID=A0ABD0JPN4_9CAEN